jgi:hypothetical protein
MKINQITFELKNWFFPDTKLENLKKIGKKWHKICFFFHIKNTDLLSEKSPTLWQPKLSRVATFLKYVIRFNSSCGVSIFNKGLASSKKNQEQTNLKYAASKNLVFVIKLYQNKQGFSRVKFLDFRFLD